MCFVWGKHDEGQIVWNFKAVFMAKLDFDHTNNA